MPSIKCLDSDKLVDIQPGDADHLIVIPTILLLVFPVIFINVLFDPIFTVVLVSLVEVLAVTTVQLVTHWNEIKFN